MEFKYNVEDIALDTKYKSGIKMLVFDNNKVSQSLLLHEGI